jgi:peroxiredoxin
MWDRFQSAGLAVVGICVDSVEQNRAMVEKLLLPFPILSDPDSHVIGQYGVLNDLEADIAKPSLFLVRPDGSIAFTYIGEDFADRPTDEELFAAAGSIRGAA